MPAKILPFKAKPQKPRDTRVGFSLPRDNEVLRRYFIKHLKDNPNVVLIY